jgi:hypothetical protein
MFLEKFNLGYDGLHMQIEGADATFLRDFSG